MHIRVYALFPEDAGVTLCEPFVGFDPDQSLSLGLAEAVHDVAFVLDQVSITDCPSVTTVENADIVTFGLGGGGSALPPQPARSQRLPKSANINEEFLITPPRNPVPPLWTDLRFSV